MLMGNSHKYETSKESEATVGIYGILNKEEKGRHDRFQKRKWAIYM